MEISCYFRWPLILAAALLVSCGQSDETEEGAGSKDNIPVVSLNKTRGFTIEGLNRGARLFQQHCAQCHGPEAQGHPDWQRQSKFYAAAPPLNGKGRDWKLSKADFARIVKYGLSRNGVAIMPAWHARLSDRDIDDIITWCQALWPTDVYGKWLKANKDTPVKRGTKPASRPKAG